MTCINILHLFKNQEYNFSNYFMPFILENGTKIKFFDIKIIKRYNKKCDLNYNFL